MMELHAGSYFIGPFFFSARVWPVGLGSDNTVFSDCTHCDCVCDIYDGDVEYQ